MEQGNESTSRNVGIHGHRPAAQQRANSAAELMEERHTNGPLGSENFTQIAQSSGGSTQTGGMEHHDGTNEQTTNRMASQSLQAIQIKEIRAQMDSGNHQETAGGGLGHVGTPQWSAS